MLQGKDTREEEPVDPNANTDEQGIICAVLRVISLPPLRNKIESYCRWRLVDPTSQFVHEKRLIDVAIIGTTLFYLFTAKHRIRNGVFILSFIQFHLLFRKYYLKWVPLTLTWFLCGVGLVYSVLYSTLRISRSDRADTMDNDGLNDVIHSFVLAAGGLLFMPQTHLVPPVPLIACVIRYVQCYYVLTHFFVGTIAPHTLSIALVMSTLCLMVCIWTELYFEYTLRWEFDRAFTAIERKIFLSKFKMVCHRECTASLVKIKTQKLKWLRRLFQVPASTLHSYYYTPHTLTHLILLHTS